MQTIEGQEDYYWVTTHALLGGGIVILLSFIQVILFVGPPPEPYLIHSRWTFQMSSDRL
jgi:hypothetical protein